MDIKTVAWLVFMIGFSIAMWLECFTARGYPAFGGESVVAPAILVYAIWRTVKEVKESK